MLKKNKNTITEVIGYHHNCLVTNILQKNKYILCLIGERKNLTGLDQHEGE